MPHIPKQFVNPTQPSPTRFSGTTRTPPELHWPREKREEKSSKRRPLGSSINMRTYAPDPNNVFESLFGERPHVDRNTGILVRKRGPASASPGP